MAFLSGTASIRALELDTASIAVKPAKHIGIGTTGLGKGLLMNRNLVAKSSVLINAPTDKVWNALVTPAAVKEYMFGTNVASDWKEGSPITWKGEWEGKSYEDKGVIVRINKGETLQYTHFSPLAGLPDKPENYHTVTIDLARKGAQTEVSLAQDNNTTEEDRAHSEKNWQTMLTGLKKYVEKG